MSAQTRETKTVKNPEKDNIPTNNHARSINADELNVTALGEWFGDRDVEIREICSYSVVLFV
jgi:hypothetical protein